MAKFVAVKNAPRDPSLPINIEFDTSDLERLQEMFPNLAKAVKQAYVRSLGRAMRSGESFAGKRYRQSYPKVPLSLLREKYLQSKVVQAGDKISEIGGLLRIKGSGILLEYFSATKSADGVTWQSLKGPVNIKRGFYANVFAKSNRKAHWFRRTDEAVQNKKRFPVEFLWGPSPYQVFNKPGPLDELTDHLTNRMLNEIGPQLGFYMDKAVKDALKTIAKG